MSLSAAVRRIAFVAACLLAGSAPVQAGGVALFTGATTAEGRIEPGLRFPDGSGLPTDAIALAARQLGAREADLVLWFQDAGFAQRLAALPPEQRVAYTCLPHDGETFEAGDAMTQAAAPGLLATAWVGGEVGRIAWWPSVPAPEACGAAIAIVTATPAGVAFGDVLLGASAQADVAIGNAGRVALEITSAAIQGAGFSLLQNACNGKRLEPGATCALRVEFAPGAAGAATGKVTLANSGTPPSVEVPLSGTGIAPGQLTFAPAALAFGDVTVGNAAMLPITAGNTGGAALTIATAAVAGAGFTLSSNACNGVQLDPGESCAMAVDFAPAAAGDAAGTLELALAGGGAAQAVLGGRGVAAPSVLQVDPTELAFGQVAVGLFLRRGVTLSNGGASDIPLGAITASGDAFTVAEAPCANAVLAPAQSCLVLVDFAPPAPGLHAGTLAIARGDAQPGTDITLGGRGLLPAAIAFSPTALAFGEVALAATPRATLTASNDGEADLALGTASLDAGGFAIAADACSGATLAGGASCEIAIDFVAATAGDYAATLTLPRSDAGAAGTLAIGGRKLAPPPPQPTLEPATLDFGSVDVGSTLRRSVTIGNAAGSPLALDAVAILGSGFTVAGDACSGATLAATQSCAVAIDFAPDAAATFAGTLRVTRADAGAALEATLAGTGAPVAPQGPHVFGDGFE